MSVPALGGNAAILWFFLSEFVLRSAGSARRLATSAEDRATTWLIIAAYVACVIALNLPALHAWALPDGVAWAGLAAAALGTLLRAWAMRTLGQFYTRTLQVGAAQTVVTSGPYTWLRHPGYAGALLVWVGAALTFGFGAATLAVFAILLATYVRRISAEERLLLAQLGEPYRRYRQSTSRLVPGVW
jgi:protein-S-isoprenylcysteine O-methyltransferase Ste14